MWICKYNYKLNKHAAIINLECHQHLHMLQIKSEDSVFQEVFWESWKESEAVFSNSSFSKALKLPLCDGNRKEAE